MKRLNPIFLLMVGIGLLVSIGSTSLKNDAERLDMTLPILKITDGTTEVDLIQRGGNAFYLNAWRPAIAQMKGGGTWQQSSLSDGRRLVHAQLGNAVESFDLKIADLDPDAIIRETQTLRRLLNKAIEYGTESWPTESVWIEDRASNETNTRYALIYSWSTPDDENPFAQPFLQPYGGSAMDRFTLTIERGHWLATAPGIETCVQISGQGNTTLGETAVNYAVSQSSDDAGYAIDTGFLLNSIILYLGKDTSESSHFGMRFQTVLVPQGATILSAFLRFEAEQNTSDTVCKVLISGEDADNPTTFTTLLDFVSRTKTSASVVWPNDPFGIASIPAWTAGVDYDSPDISTIIQEIVDRSGWASGQDMVLFVDDDGSTASAERRASSFDSVVGDPPELHITYTASDQTVGRSATCDEEVYVANKSNQAGISHIYMDDGGVIGANQVASTAFNILPAIPVANDAIYFGIDSTLVESGPFSSLIFDINQIAIGTTCVWEYYDSVVPSWVAIPSLADRTDPGGTGANAFKTAAVNGVFWQPEATWTTVDLNTALGYGPAITAWWVRCRVTVAVAPIGPTQQNREIYTVIWNSILIDNEQVEGDISALAKHVLRDQGGDMYTAVLPYTSRVICGIRSISRGANFVSFLNLAPEGGVGHQNPAGISIEHRAKTADQTVIECATGTAARFNPTLATESMASRVDIWLDRTIANEYTGQFHAYIRAEQDSGSVGDFEVQLAAFFGLGQLAWYGNIVPTYTTGEWMLLDMGVIPLPIPLDSLADENYRIIIRIQASSSNASANLDFYDLVLIPVDEWAGDFVEPSKDSFIQTSFYGNRVELDSVTKFRPRISALIKDDNSNDVSAVWSTITNGPVQFRQNSDQRLHLLFSYYTIVGAGVQRSVPFIFDTIQSFKNQRYLSMRGDR